MPLSEGNCNVIPMKPHIKTICLPGITWSNCCLKWSVPSYFWTPECLKARIGEGFVSDFRSMNFLSDRIQIVIHWALQTLANDATSLILSFPIIEGKTVMIQLTSENALKNQVDNVFKAFRIKPKMFKILGLMKMLLLLKEKAAFLH